MRHPKFGHPVVTKERPSRGNDFLGKYRVTKVVVSHFVWNNLYILVNTVIMFQDCLYEVQLDQSRKEVSS